MKKLMITAAALLTACVVGASGTDFESYPLGALSLDYDEDGLSQGTYWSSAQLGESEVKEESEGGNKFLAIDESVPLYRNMFKSNENKQSETVDVEQSVYFSSRVKFTASEDASMTPNPGDKLIVWLRSVDGEGPTNLIVTAYNSAEEAAQDYVIDNKTISDDAFHTLNIVASADDGAVKFTVSVDGDVLSSGGVTEFQSLVRGGTGIDTITCAGFKGSGAIDDIEFGTIEENPTKYYEVDGVEYIEFADALAAAATAQDSTIKLVNDAILNYDGGEGAGFYNTDDLVIDLAGCTISCEGVVFANEGTLTILDTVGGGSVENTAENAEKNSIENYEGGDVYISGGIYLGAVYNDDDSGSIVVTLNGNPAELVLDDDSESETYGYWVIQASSEPPAPTTYELTIPTVTGASATVTDKDTGDEIDDLAAIEDGTVVTVTWEADDGYKITAGATEEITMDDDQTADTPTVVAITYVTLTITPVENCTIVVSNATAEVATGATFDVDDAVELTVYRTPAEGYELDNCAATEAITMNQDQTVTAAVKQSGGDEYPSYIDPSDTETKDKYDTWATTYSVADGESSEEAFLLNCAPNAEAVAAAKEAFKVTITVNADGTVTVTAPDDYNVTPKIQGKQTLSNTEEWHDKTDGDKFFRAVLEL